MYYIITKKNILISSIAILIVIVCSVSCFVFSKTSSSWGLSFGAENEPPKGNATPEELLEHNAYYIADTSKKEVYLTFDVGYEAGYMESILDTLKKHNVKAAFFVVGNYLTSEPELVKRMCDEGHIVGNHTKNHPDMSKMSTIEDFKAQIEPVEELYKQITGKEMPKYYRPPQGIYNIQNLEDAKSLGYKTIFWSLAYVDWERNNQPSHEKALSILLKRVHNGAIILLHSTSKTNMEILDTFLTTLEEKGYSFSTLDKLGKN